MTQKKLSVNIVYSLIVQISAFIAPLITAPYIARVFSPELIGDYSYVLANSFYFVLAECLGLTLYGAIKIAAIRDDKEKLSQLFWEIFFLKLILMSACAGVYTVWFVVLGKAGYRTLYFIMLLNILANGIDVTWLLNGLEDFKLTAIRSIIVRIINVFAILIFVKSEKDFFTYAIMMQAFNFLGYLALYPNIHKKVIWLGLKKLNMKQHFAPSCIYFVPGLINVIFSSTDKTILGMFTKNSYEVGVYEQANKICQLCMGMISAISNVIFPRVTYLYHNSKDRREVIKLLDMSVRLAIFLAMPISFGIAAVSDYFIPIFFGNGYEKSAMLLKILCFNVLFVALSNFLGQQCLIARGKQKEYNISISVGALLNICMNLCLVNELQSAGVAIASAITSFFGVSMIIWYGRDVIHIGRIVQISKHYFYASIIMFLSINWINISNSAIITLFVQISLGFVIYVFLLFLFRDEMLSSFIVVRIKNRLKK